MFELIIKHFLVRLKETGHSKARSSHVTIYIIRQWMAELLAHQAKWLAVLRRSLRSQVKMLLRFFQERWNKYQLSAEIKRIKLDFPLKFLTSCQSLKPMDCSLAVQLLRWKYSIESTPVLNIVFLNIVLFISIVFFYD